MNGAADRGREAAGRGRLSAAPFAALYVSVVFLSMIEPEKLAYYNAYVILAFCVVLLWCERRAGVYLFASLLAAFVAYFSLWNNATVLHILIDAGVIFYIASSADIAGRLRIGPRAMACLWLLLFLLTAASVLNIANPDAYREYPGGDVRYGGIFSGGNSSSSMFLIFQILLWEAFEKRGRRRGWRMPLLLFFIITLIIYAVASKTRTMLFALPYWAYQLYEVFGGRLTITGLACLAAAAGPVSVYVQENLRMEQDGSYNTRAALYAVQIAGIAENFALIPHGAGAANALSKEITGNDDFTPHNDFLRYIYDWGAAFWAMLVFLIVKIRQAVRADFEFFLILLAYSGFALHNLLFLPYVWLPFIFILTLWTKTENHGADNAGCSKKV